MSFVLAHPCSIRARVGFYLINNESGRQMTVLLHDHNLCRNCSGSGSYKSNVSRTFLKCHLCRGTGRNPKSIVLNPKVQEKWMTINQEKKQEISNRLTFKKDILLKPAWQRVFYLPNIWWKQYKISRKTLSLFDSLKFSFLWTIIIAFPTFALKILKKRLGI